MDDRNASPVIASASKRLIPNNYASAGLIRSIILNQYWDPMPLYRQEMTLKYRCYIAISRITMGNWMYLIADWLALIYKALREEIRQSGYMQIDETFIKYQDREKDHCPNGYLWAYHSPAVGVLLEWFPSRAADCLDAMLSGYEGYMQTDGYGAYPSGLNHPDHKQKKAPSFMPPPFWSKSKRSSIANSAPTAKNQLWQSDQLRARPLGSTESLPRTRHLRNR